MSGAPVSWRSKKQSCIALSTAEAECMSLTSAAQEAIWLIVFLLNYRRSQLHQLSYMKTTNQLYVTKNPTFHGRRKHIAIKYHLIRDEIK